MSKTLEGLKVAKVAAEGRILGILQALEADYPEVEIQGILVSKGQFLGTLPTQVSNVILEIKIA